jgi:hypothetical protein
MKLKSQGGEKELAIIKLKSNTLNPTDILLSFVMRNFKIKTNDEPSTIFQNCRNQY